MSRFLLSKATSSSESPTPGYMYNEIADLTLQGSTEKVLKFLCARLKKQNPQVGKKWEFLLLFFYCFFKKYVSYTFRYAIKERMGNVKLWSCVDKRIGKRGCVLG